ncbi:MAG: molybdopterin-dependent oxidoreductase [Proteobacteria bacterium]|nr:molybdopterin-dependent oxidoreductase [Pseudomonadota bacterium]MBU1741565.1 molybdopterin-dependent oxidoreductase [Pseudomonadota bacterium]
MGQKIVRSACRGCHGGCGVLVTVEDDRVTGIKGDPDCPINRGWLCIKGKKYHTITHHPSRLTDPLIKRNGSFQAVSWDQALDLVSERFLRIKKELGPESVVLGYGTGRDNEAFIYRLANTFGTPNVLTAGHMCYGPRIVTGITRCGNLPVVDYEGRPACVIVWGANPLVSNPDEYKGIYLARAMLRGTKIICVDPRRSMVAKRADPWLRIKPGTDGALAWGMINHLIAEKLYDAEFIESYVHGWDEFVARAGEYPIAWAAAKTGLGEDEIRAAAEMFARHRPAGIHWGVALEQSRNCVNTISLLICLMAMTGNLDRPGGSVFYPNPPVQNASQVGAHRVLDPDVRGRRLGGDRFRLADRIGVINPKAVWDAILEEKPYPVRALYLISTNPVISRANAKQVMAALKKVDFLVVQDFFMTPTANEADVVLPASTWLEHDYVGDLWKRHGWVVARQKAVQVGQARSDYDILNDLGKRCTDEKFWWPTIKDALNEVLSPSGLSWEDFCARGFLQGERRFHKYRTDRFRTPTGKVEFYSTIMERLGFDPLPGYLDPPESPWSSPDVAQRFPYQLITGARIPSFFHSENRQPGLLRSKRPEPLVEMHPEVAAAKGIVEGDWVEISSPRGAVRQKAVVTDRVPENVIAADHGWWYPEDTKNLGWDRSNIDVLTDNAFETCDPAMGATSLRVLLCDVRRVDGP